MRKDVEFKTEDGVTLRGWLYLPDRASGRVPTIVMAHGFSAVKENYSAPGARATVALTCWLSVHSTATSSAPSRKCR
jgi:fermentation-respiration switch protein FrsA (DUF1100 family)